MGVIDTLTAGFKLVFKRPWLALVPLLIDLGLWRAPKISVALVVEQVLEWIDKAAVGIPGSSQAAGAGTEELALALRETVASTNLAGALVWNRLGVPSIVATLPIASTDRVLELTQVWQVGAIQIVLLLLGLLLAAVYLVAIGQSVRGAAVSPGAFARATLRAWASLAVIVIALGIGTFSALIGSAVLGLLAVFLFVGLIWALLYAYFFPQAVTLYGYRPLPAIVSSFHVVRGSLWSTLGLLLLVNVLDAGLSLIWQRMIGAIPGGILLAIVASALVGTSLTAALFFYYSDRWAALIKMQRTRQAVQS